MSNICMISLIILRDVRYILSWKISWRRLIIKPCNNNLLFKATAESRAETINVPLLAFLIDSVSLFFVLSLFILRRTLYNIYYIHANGAASFPFNVARFFESVINYSRLTPPCTRIFFDEKNSVDFLYVFSLIARLRIWDTFYVIKGQWRRTRVIFMFVTKWWIY